MKYPSFGAGFILCPLFVSLAMQGHASHHPQLLE